MMLVARVAGILWSVIMAAALAPAAIAGSQRQASVHALLDVPYVPQTPELCGGAAVAMVLRTGGNGRFSGGLRLARGSQRAGYSRRRRGPACPRPKLAGDGRLERPETHMQRRQASTGTAAHRADRSQHRTYHYVVIVGATEKEVVVHDPAPLAVRVLPGRASIARGRPRDDG